MLGRRPGNGAGARRAGDGDTLISLGLELQADRSGERGSRRDRIDSRHLEGVLVGYDEVALRVGDALERLRAGGAGDHHLDVMAGDGLPLRIAESRRHGMGILVGEIISGLGRRERQLVGNRGQRTALLLDRQERPGVERRGRLTALLLGRLDDLDGPALHVGRTGDDETVGEEPDRRLHRRRLARQVGERRPDGAGIRIGVPQYVQHLGRIIGHDLRLRFAEGQSMLDVDAVRFGGRTTIDRDVERADEVRHVERAAGRPRHRIVEADAETR